MAPGPNKRERLRAGETLAQPTRSSVSKEALRAFTPFPLREGGRGVKFCRLNPSPIQLL
jgi:hypothetical protein